ncbi:probable ubiquitin-like-specific protease 2B [Lolium perenne]|uniref:probable ubiquitin-like-specific protease 2B n=1 Tax=Lolium perenne TaxID=4522 RepID=UPI0021F589CC|nr:ubiquitin-like-specific protease 1D [Lolium perenne]XP_051179799.1 ubiquitin-like-specific protease 1D [Lolium perenne]
MPRSSRRNPEPDVVDHGSDDDGNVDVFQNKCSQTSRGQEAKTSLSLKNASPSFHLPPNKRSSRRHKTSKDKLDTEIFEMCMEDVWTCIDPEKMTDYAYFDSLWFNIYTNENDKSNVLRWIKAKKIFTRRYVFVPIVGWGHWSVLVLCNFGETKYLGTEKGPRMLLLDSLKTKKPTRLRTAINRFVVDNLKNEEREEIEQFINEVELEIPEVPQQSGDDCGIYVLYFIYCFLVIEEMGEDLSKLDALFDPEELKNLEDIRNDIHAYREKRDAKIAE